ncbi:DNA repair protein XRCC4 [Cinnamomum micranthum f. kanehirae]|uniref:DNA repair protein XRCC4 n=1 Tax=Cinnamomum micranthum f. kanehirae TaxID=337451 RepID=A0A3S3MGZ1_9MAGN|nr:DNA repair protein XRCC4 [Cinnamomum micranthum f. kanehirae]
MEESTRHTCLRLELGEKEEEEESSNGRDVIFIKGTWFDNHFSLSITDGSLAWICNEWIARCQRGQNNGISRFTEYIVTAERYLGFQQPGSVYTDTDMDTAFFMLSWTFEKQGMKLEWRWKCQPSSNNKQTTAEILDFLMDANIRLSEEVVRKTQSFERLRAEAEKCLAQSEKFNNEKREFESAVYAKFVGVLNSKKAKLRELRDQLSKHGVKSPQDEDDESTDRTEIMGGSEDEISNEEPPKSLPSSSKSSPAAKGQKRKTRK